MREEASGVPLAGSVFVLSTKRYCLGQEFLSVCVVVRLTVISELTSDVCQHLLHFFCVHVLSRFHFNRGHSYVQLVESVRLLQGVSFSHKTVLKRHRSDVVGMFMCDFP